MSDTHKAKKSHHPTNEHDVKRTEIRCRDDIQLKLLDNQSKFIGLLYAGIWAGAIVACVQIIASHASK